MRLLGLLLLLMGLLLLLCSLSSPSEQLDSDCLASSIRALFKCTVLENQGARSPEEYNAAVKEIRDELLRSRHCSAKQNFH